MVKVIGSCGYYLVDTPLVVKISEYGNVEWAKTYDDYLDTTEQNQYVKQHMEPLYSQDP